MYKDDVQYTLFKTGDKREQNPVHTQVETAFKTGSGICLLANKGCFSQQYADVTPVRLLTSGSEVLQIGIPTTW